MIRHGAMGTLGIRKGLGEGQGISCLDTGGMSRHLCPYSCPPVKHNFRRCLKKRRRGELAEAKGCLENPRSLHTVSPSLHRSCTGQTLAWSLAPPAQAMRGGRSLGSLGSLGPSLELHPGTPGSVLLLCDPLSALLFLPLFSASLQHKTISDNPSWSQAPSLPAASMGLCPGCQAELLGTSYGGQSL